MSNTDDMWVEGFLNIMNMAAEKIPAEKLMMVPMLLLMIDTETWKFPPQFKLTEIREVIDFIENSEELKSIFQKKKNEECPPNVGSSMQDNCKL